MTRADARRLLVAYDIPDDRRRLRLAKVLQGFGDRVQYSVFIVDAAPVKLNRMRRAVAEVIDVRADSVLFCDLGALSSLDASRFSWLGLERVVTNQEGSFIV